MQCYERFHWTPSDIPNIPEWEAARLSVYFEELAAYEHQKNKELEDERRRGSSGSGTQGRSERIEEIIPADDEEDEEEWP